MPLQPLLEQLPMGVVLVRAATGTIAYANRRAEEIVGQRLFDGGAPIFYSELPLYRSDRTTPSRGDTLLSRVLDGEGPLREEHAFLHSDGELVTALAIATPIRDEAGRLVSVFILLDDASDRGLTRDNREQSEKTRDFFVGMLAHDLRAPLSSILAGASLLMRRPDTPPEHARLLQRVIACAERMSRMVGSTLDFARARLGGGIPLRRVPSPLREIVRVAVQELHATCKRELRMDMPVAGDGSWDVDRMTQLVSNLVGNAIKHGDPSVAVNVSLRETSDAVCLRVHNGGSAIEPRVLCHVFNPFQRPQTEGQGLGLGLYIANEIVRAHRGTIAIESSDASGTAVTVCLPLALG